MNDAALTTRELDRLAAALTAVADEAGATIMGYYRGDLAVAEKADRTLVTAADHASEAVILGALEALTPAYPVVSEEAAGRSGAPRIGAGPFWLVDPLDGTREFVDGRDEFTVNIALVNEGLPVLGVVLAPALEVTYIGHGTTAFRKQTRGEREPIAARAPAADGLVIVASRSHRSAADEAYLKGQTVKALRSAGSSIKFCVIAAGEADLYPRFGRTMEWDTAAGHAVLSAAGGSVVTTEEKPLIYGKAGFENPDFIARGRAQ